MTLDLSKEAEAVALEYDRRAGAIRKWIHRHPNATMWIGVGAVAVSFWLGIKWQQFAHWAFG